MQDWSTSNLLAWMEQAFVLASLGSLLLLAFRIRHPWTKLAYCHGLLVVCLLLPWIQPWRHPQATPAEASWIASPQARLVLWVLIAGGAAKLGWLLAGLWRIRKCRILSMPMYPIPESVRAASAVTHADALFCVSAEVPGPVMLGWLTPVVLLPESFLAMAEEAQCGVACHELLHVRRHDWLITVLEELAGTLLWFNPAIWPLLAQARLAREQLVDAEVVRLTAARDSYIDALLAIARGGSRLDLAPAPLFLRRRHLTQRVHSLLKDTASSNLRLIWSYASITAMLALAGWFGIASFPLIGRAAPPASAPVPPAVAVLPPIVAAEPAPPPELAAQASTPEVAAPDRPNYIPSAPVPQDPRELVTGSVRALTDATEDASARAQLQQARLRAIFTTEATPPYRFDVSFTAAGNVAHTGPGQLTEIWMPQHRRWTADLAGFSVVRWTTNGLTVEDQHAPMIPVRVAPLRDAIHWAGAQLPVGRLVRSAAVEWNGRPATCLLFSNWSGPATVTQGRLWEENEYCIDDASGLLQIQSISPGTYTVYEYGRNLQFHGHAVADHIAIYTGGVMVADAQFTIADMSPADQVLLTPQQGMAASGPIVVLQARERTPLNTPNPFPAKLIQPVIVEAEIDGRGNVIEEEFCAAADPALAQTALDLVKKTRFLHRAGTQYQLFVNVKFMPSQK
jgi:beta-lactamase regulating signal transducer with metallopeptidase domain